MYVCTGGTEWALRGPKVDNDGIEEALRDPEIGTERPRDHFLFVFGLFFFLEKTDLFMWLK